jgi:hypothetical protein
MNLSGLDSGLCNYGAEAQVVQHLAQDKVEELGTNEFPAR